MADFDKIRRNVARMVDAGAPESDIDSYLGTEGTTPEQLRSAAKGGDRSFAGDADLKKQYDTSKRINNVFPGQATLAAGGRRIFDSAMMGAGDEVLAGLGALAETPFGNRTLSENYDRNLKFQRALRDDARSELPGAAGTVADLTGGFAALPARGVSAAGAVAPIGTETWGQGLRRIAGESVAAVPQLAKVGAGYGAVNAFAGTDGNASSGSGIMDHLQNRLYAVPSGMAEGAAGAVVIGTGLRGMLGARDIRRGQVAERKDRQMLNRMEWEAEGQTAPGYAITESRSVQATAPSLADSIVGGSIRNDASARTRGLEARAQQLIREQTGGASSNDLGEAMQGTLRRNLHEYDIPNREISQMSNAELERIAGPVTDQGFRPPRQEVQPVQPRNVPEVTPEQFQKEGLAGRVRPVEPINNAPSRREFGDYSPELIVRDMDLQARAENFNNKYNSGSSKSMREIPAELPTRRQNIEAEAVAKKHDELLAKHIKKYPELGRERAYNSDYMEAELRRDPQFASEFDRMQKLRQRYNRLLDELRPMREEHAALLAEREKLAADKEAYADDAFKKVAKERHAKAMADAQAETLRQNARAETEARREQARQESIRETQAARDAADRAYEEELSANPNGFRAGRTSHTYPTEFSAGYERVRRETPKIQRNILGGKNEPTATATESLLYDFASAARRQNQAVGYQDGRLFGIDGSVMHPGVAGYLERSLGADIAGQLQAYARRRPTGGFNPGIDGIRDLRTSVRRAARDAERGAAPGDMRTTDAAMLRRLEGALTEDMHVFQQQAGPQGQRSSQMMRGVDQEYRRVAEELRRPLARLYGDRVVPIDAMNRLGRAASDGDTRTLSAFMRVMSEKDNPTRAAAAIVSHMTEGATSVQSFIRGYGSLPAESRNILFRGPEGQAVRGSLDRLERLMSQMQRYQGAVTNGGGIDFTRRVNLMLGTVAIANPVNALVAAGGGALFSRFMTSARYVNWLTAIPRASERGWTSQQAMKHVARLSALAQNDPDRERGKQILKVASNIVLPSKAIAAPLSPADRASMKSITEKVIFAGERSATADRNALAEAKNIDDSGSTSGETLKKTGWVKAQDGKYRYEIDDSNAFVSDDGKKSIEMALKIKAHKEGIATSLSAILEHEALYEAYPNLRTLPVEIFNETSFPALKKMHGYYDMKAGKIVINADSAKDGIDSILQTIIHEVQHGVQRIENFSYGKERGLTSGYGKRPGEVEAWDTGSRIDMTAQQRREKLPALVERANQLDWVR